MISRALSAVLALGLAVPALSSTGCVKQALLDGQIESTRKASAAIDTLADYEIARSIAHAGLGQFEGMHYLAPDNEDALLSLAKSWTSVGIAFIEDEMEIAEDEDGEGSPRAVYHQQRAKTAYDRAIHYGVELLEHRAPGFAEAKRNDETIRTWAATFTGADDAPALYWTATAWMAKAAVSKGDPEIVAELYVGVALMERAVALDDTVAWGAGHVALGAYHGALSQDEEAKKHFERAFAISQDRLLIAKFQYATKFACLKGDRETYEKTLRAVVDAGDVFPEQRLSNAVAKRRAARWLTPARMATCGF